ncbi:MAG: TGS domain-containing protein [Dehalococcoidia bacterium]|nr:TGS domain-containing protein [Dehalococcoidia bacterium]
MPANLPPQYFEAEKRYRAARTPQEKIEALEEMFALMPKHKGTDRLRAELRTKIAKLSEEAERRPFVAKKGSQLYYVRKEGAGQAALVGLANVGKSRLVAALTQAAPQVADYPFTTRLPIPGMMEYENVQVQLVDLPAITAPEVSSWLPNIVKNADLVLIVVDVTLDPVAQLDTVLEWLAKHRMAASNELKEPPPGMTHVKRALVIANKTDMDNSQQALELLLSRCSGKLPVIAVSASRGDGLEEFREMVYKALDVVRVYTKPPGGKADLTEPSVVKRGSTVGDVAETVHKDFARNLKYAQVWGSGKFDGQRVRRDYVLQDGDIIELHT